jgi:Flavin-binding monooxygenase-like
MDIAVEASFVARRTFLSSRRGAYILPKYVFGRPLDQVGAFGPLARLPWPVRRTVLSTIYRVAVGRVERYGLPTPDHRIGEAHPTVSADFLSRIAHDEISWRPNIAALEGDHVRFVDGSREQVDVIVWCTGYKVTFPFFDPDFISAPDNDLPLYRRVFKPGIDNLFFVGLVQPLGAAMPIAEAQGQWIADYLCGDYRLPPEAIMAADIGHEREVMANRYVASKRHTMQVDYDVYMHGLAKERGAGAQRARAAGHPLPVAARLDTPALSPG